jgi:hypothetical protein
VDLTEFAAEVGVGRCRSPSPASSPAAARFPACGACTAPAGIEWIQPDEMTVCCGAGTPVAELSAALADTASAWRCRPGGTVGGALAIGHSGVRRLGDGPVRDVLLQARYVSADGES